MDCLFVAWLCSYVVCFNALYLLVKGIPAMHDDWLHAYVSTYIRIIILNHTNTKAVIIVFLYMVDYTVMFI